MAPQTTGIDLEKRRRVMARSIKLGHCVCDARRPCPCDIFKNDGVCPCAGERPAPPDVADVRLTELTHNPGCASKIAPADLEAVLAQLPAVNDPAVVSGLAAGDDAAIYRIADGTTLVQTVDVFTPCVDDAYTFGRICAANCLSDIYAMGGVPRTALSILAFPSETLPAELMRRMLAGAMEVLAQANCALVGGHSIKDNEIKLGFAITGTIDADKAFELDTACDGDLLVLTKPLGTGVAAFARQIGRADAIDISAVEQSMTTLNKAAADALHIVGASACTDVTGFGLFGHLLRLARKSRLRAHVDAAALPAFAGVAEALRDGVVPGAVERNLEFVGPSLHVQAGVDEAMVHLGLDAQTSGGLLICVAPPQHARLVEALHSAGAGAWTIGSLSAGEPGIELAASSGAGFANPQPQAKTCCPAGEGQPANTAHPANAFGAFMKSTAAAGAIDERTKELINFALVLHARCEPCVEAHLQNAAQMGIGRDELDEAAWCATAMGGAPVRMFYLECLKKYARGDARKPSPASRPSCC